MISPCFASDSRAMKSGDRVWRECLAESLLTLKVQGSFDSAATSLREAAAALRMTSQWGQPLRFAMQMLRSG